MARLTEGGLMTQSRQEIIEKLRGRVSRRAGIRDSISVIITLFGGQRKRALRQGFERGWWEGWGVEGGVGVESQSGGSGMSPE